MVCIKTSFFLIYTEGTVFFSLIKFMGHSFIQIAKSCAGTGKVHTPFIQDLAGSTLLKKKNGVFFFLHIFMHFLYVKVHVWFIHSIPYLFFPVAREKKSFFIHSFNFQTKIYEKQTFQQKKIRYLRFWWVLQVRILGVRESAKVSVTKRNSYFSELGVRGST